MKLNTITKGILAVLATSSIAQGAVSLTFSAVTGAANGVLTNLQSSTGVNNVQRVWGVLVDEGDDGVALGEYLFGASLLASSTSTLQTNVGGVATNTNDKLYIASALMVNSNNATLDGGTLVSGNLARPTSFLNIPTPNGSLGDNFYIVWFDEVAFGGATVEGGNYGAFRLSNFEIPADGNAVNFSANFVGADPARTANLEWTAITVIPETSTSLLGALGALALLRRRRN